MTATMLLFIMVALVVVGLGLLAHSLEQHPIERSGQITGWCGLGCIALAFGLFFVFVELAPYGVATR